MNDDDFEWDDAKAFSDPFGLEFEDDRHDDLEKRYVLLGMSRVLGMSLGRLLVVVHVLRGETVRIISAREAEPHERRQYHEENT